MVYKEYKVILVSEGALGTIFLGASGLPIKSMELDLNEAVADGWQVVFQFVEKKRLWLFWSRETVVITLGR